MSCNTAAQLVRMKADIRSARNLLDAQLTGQWSLADRAYWHQGPRSVVTGHWRIATGPTGTRAPGQW